MSTARRLRRVLSLILGQEPPLRLRAWDGSESGPSDAPLVVIRSRDALRRLARHPDELGLGRAYVAGDIDAPGDIYATLSALGRGEDTDRAKSLLTKRKKAEIAGLAVLLGAVGREPPPPPEEAVLAGDRHSKARDRAAISHHYDVGNDFYRLVLGESMVYSCAYWRRPDDPAYGLADAQRDKVDLVCRKLGLRSGMRLLDVGCGWGTTVIHAAREYGVQALGVTLSREQAELARKRVAQAGLSDLVEIRLQDYRDVADGPFDAISSIGMAEHVGENQYGGYARALYDLLRPGGRLLNHQISRRPGPTGDGPSFIERYVFPDGELIPVGRTVSIIEESGFEIRDVESLREHYALTLRCWVANLEADWDRAVQLSSPGRARVWRLYMAGSALSFEAGRIGVNQVLAVRVGPDGSSGLPPTRADWLGTV
ncbi:MAG: cyclopropane-fatty-acyl-phospholipid synthase [Actinomycetota bacterium]|jgi:cyclopropane-fatty-acyl-phospholipid synthase|nr:cyclopropane-fatty-acyl-phospholipid synthase [Actinomycetota bacterium]